MLVRRNRGLVLASALALGVVVGGGMAEASGPRPVRAPGYRPTAVLRPADVAPSPMLGTFYPSPTINVRGDWPTGSGYTPSAGYGDQTMSLYGPLSAFRTQAAPVVVYARGYDGRVVPVPATAISYPNQPIIAPVIYPTQATYYYGLRESGIPPWWRSGINWIDQR